jgi:hypothetical protein
MRDEGANASWFLLSLVLYFASPFFARSTAARTARAVFSNPSVASHTFSGKPFTSDPSWVDAGSSVAVVATPYHPMPPWNAGCGPSDTSRRFSLRQSAARLFHVLREQPPHTWSTAAAPIRWVNFRAYHHHRTVGMAEYALGDAPR